MYIWLYALEGLQLGVHNHAAVNNNDSSIRVLTGAGRQVDGSASDILGAADAADRDVGNNDIAKLLERLLHHLGLERARSNGIDENVAVSELAGKMLGELVNSGLGRRVGIGLVSRDIDTVDGANVNHARWVLGRSVGLQQRQATGSKRLRKSHAWLECSRHGDDYLRLGQEKDALDIEVHDLAEG